MKKFIRQKPQYYVAIIKNLSKNITIFVTDKQDSIPNLKLASSVAVVEANSEVEAVERFTKDILLPNVNVEYELFHSTSKV